MNLHQFMKLRMVFMKLQSLKIAGIKNLNEGHQLIKCRTNLLMLEIIQRYAFY
jgi:hypothetical protein